MNIPKNRVQIIFSYYIIHVSKFGFSAVCASCRKNLCISRPKESGISVISDNDTCLSKVYVQTNVIPNFLFVIKLIIDYRLSITWDTCTCRYRNENCVRVTENSYKNYYHDERQLNMCTVIVLESRQDEL